MSKVKTIIIILILILVVFILLKNYLFTNQKTQIFSNIQEPSQITEQNPLSISVMRKKSYPGSDITIEQTLEDGTNYKQYIASYISDGLKINGLLTVPIGEKPKNGWPAIIFIHGYIPPTTYRTTQRYVAYVDAFARVGYVVFKPDLRGNGDSEGQPEGTYYSPAYAIDALNALASVKKYNEVNPDKIGMWGHSMGGNVTLRDLVVDTKDIKAAVIWGGVVGDYNDLMNNWQRRVTYQPSPTEYALRNRYRADLIKKYGTPESNPDFWNTIDPTNFINDITAPVQLHTGASDEEVPPDFSKSLYDKLLTFGKTAEYYSYPGADHNISQSFNLAMQRSVEFFNRYLK